MSSIEHIQEWLDAEGYNPWDLGEAKIELIESSIVLLHGRWTIHYLDVYADDEGHVFGIAYDVPATEMQEGSEGDPAVVAVQPVMSWSLG